MLILVGVTVNLLAQGGIFGKAENATTGTTKHSDKEQLISAMVGGVQTGGKFVMTDVTLPEGAKWITSKENVAEIASPSGNGNWVMTQSGNKFYIDKYGNVLDDEPNVNGNGSGNGSESEQNGTVLATVAQQGDYVKYGEESSTGKWIVASVDTNTNTVTLVSAGAPEEIDIMYAISNSKQASTCINEQIGENGSKRAQYFLSNYAETIGAYTNEDELTEDIKHIGVKWYTADYNDGTGMAATFVFENHNDFMGCVYFDFFEEERTDTFGDDLKLAYRINVDLKPNIAFSSGTGIENDPYVLIAK